MPQVTRIPLTLPLCLGTVTCYLLRGEDGDVLVDTGCSTRRQALAAALTAAGCTPRRLRLVVLTHGDFDHAGNAAWLREAYGAPVAIHAADAVVVERGDMFCNRRSGGRLMNAVAATLFCFGRAERFTPDVFLADGDDLRSYGLHAEVIALPGHSPGSIGILTATGDLFCGDLLDGTKAPALSAILDDVPAAEASLTRLAAFGVGTVYPGHGAPFAFGHLVAATA